MSMNGEGREWNERWTYMEGSRESLPGKAS